jgi:hypothetical protein
MHYGYLAISIWEVSFIAGVIGFEEGHLWYPIVIKIGINILKSKTFIPTIQVDTVHPYYGRNDH